MTAAYYDDPNYLYGNASRYYDDVPTDYDLERLVWRFEVAWKGGMFFFSEDDGTTEASIAISCSWSRGRQKFVNYDSSGLSRFDPGVLTITLTDSAGRYDPRNTSSALYGYIEPGKFARLIVRLNGSLVHKHRFSGVIQDIQARIDDKGQKSVDITIACGWGYLQESDVYLPAVANTNPSVSLPNVLSSAGWPQIWGSDLDDGPGLLPFFWADGGDARTVLHDVADTLASRVYITGDGRLHWVSRVTPAPIPSAYYTEDKLHKDIPVNNPWDYKFDLMQVTAKSVGPITGTGTIWGDTMSTAPLPYISTEHVAETIITPGDTLRLSGSYSLPAGVTFTTGSQFLICYSTLFPSTKLEAKFTSTDGYEAFGFMDLLEFRDCGVSYLAVFKNNYPVSVRLITITIVNQAYESLEQGTVTFSRTVQNASKRLKKFALSNRYLINYSHLVDHIPTLLAYYFGLLKKQWSLPVITIESRPQEQFVDIQDVIDLTISSKQIDDTFRVGYIEEHWLDATGQAVQTTIRTEPNYA